MTKQESGVTGQGSEEPGGLSHLITPALILLAAALATAPILLHGSFCGDDFEFHLGSWFDAQQSWRQGALYPHWMASANFGAGEPRFMFYPPLTWMLGAALGFVLRWPLVPVAMVFLFLAGTGFAVRGLAREAFDDEQATLAGCAAIFSGFALFTAYERTAFAELTGGFWIPLLLLFALRDRNPSAGLWRRALDGSTLPLAIVVAGCWLSDGPVGLMGCYLLAAIAAIASALARSWALLARAAIAATLGIGAASFFLIPAAWEQPWADLHAAIDFPVFRVENNWLFAHHSDPAMAPFDAVLHRASMLAVGMIGITAVGLAVWLLRLRAAEAQPVRRWWIPLAAFPAVVLFLQLPVSLAIWNLLPKLRFLQYPWRWTLVVEAPMAIFFAAAVWPGRRAKRGHVYTTAAACLVVFVIATCVAEKRFLRACPPDDTAAKLEAAFRAGGLEGTDEYEPPDADHWKIAAGLPDACFTHNPGTALGLPEGGGYIPVWNNGQGACLTTAAAAERRPGHLRVMLAVPGTGFAVLRLLRFPAWRVQVNGREVDPAHPADGSDPREDGLTEVPVPQGQVTITADWTATPDVIAGRWLSGLALLLLAALGATERTLRRKSNVRLQVKGPLNKSLF